MHLRFMKKRWISMPTQVTVQANWLTKIVQQSSSGHVVENQTLNVIGKTSKGYYVTGTIWDDLINHRNGTTLTDDKAQFVPNESVINIIWGGKLPHLKALLSRTCATFRRVVLV